MHALGRDLIGFDPGPPGVVYLAAGLGGPLPLQHHFSEIAEDVQSHGEALLHALRPGKLFLLVHSLFPSVCMWVRRAYIQKT
jgi:hypothetical protein